MYLCLFEDDQVSHLLPLVHTRAVYGLRLGIRSVLETTRAAFGEAPVLGHARASVAAVTAQEHDLLVNRIPDGLDVLFVNGRYVPESGPLLERLRRAVQGEPGRVFMQGDDVVAAWVPGAATPLVQREAITRAAFDGLPAESVSGARMLGRLWDLITGLQAALVRDYAALAGHYNIYEHPGAEVQDGARLIRGEAIYVAPGAVVRAGAILNATDGPIYIDKNATVMEAAVVRGPAYIGPHAQVKVGGNVEVCALGPHCKVGGEVHTAVLHSFSSKAHAGFLGYAYLGRWCNIGADTNSSNLRNDYGHVALYNPATQALEDSGQQFLGLFMGDHAKCGINTMFNTGTVVGVSCNLFGAGYHPRYVPSFMWGSPTARYTTYRLPKALHVAERVMARRQHTLTEADRAMLEHVYQTTEAARGKGPLR